MNLFSTITLPALVTTVTLASSLEAQVATVILREGDAVPGLPAQTITSIGNTASNTVGLSACGLNASDGSTTFSHIWAGVGTAGAIVRTESTIGIYEQVSFESNFGVSDGARVAYSPSSIDTVTGTLGLDGIWLDNSVLAIEEQPIASLPGKEWRFGSRPGITGNDIVYWVGGINDSATGANEGGGLFYFDGTTEFNAVKAGDVFVGLPPVEGPAIDFDVRFSPGGTLWIGMLDTSDPSTSDNVCVIGDVATNSLLPITNGGGLWKEGDAITTAQGGLAAESWDNFDFFGINESGSFLVTGDTDGDTANDEFLAVDGSIRYREGDVVDGETLTGSIEGAYLAVDDVVVYIWDVVDGGSSIEALFLEDRLLLKEGDLVDWDGDGFVDIDAFVDSFTGISSLTAGPDGLLAFTADIDVAGSILEGFFVLDYDCLSADVYSVSVATGGSQTLAIDAGPAHAGESYLVLGSASGTTPGFVVQGFTVPLNIDAYLNSTIAQANTAGYMMTLGVLDGLGRATATLNIPPGAPITPGTTAHHSYVTFTLTPTILMKASGAVSIVTFP